MKRIVVDENYKGVYKTSEDDYYFYIDVDIRDIEAYIEIKITLICSKQ